jgi:hypothetical protein
MVDRYRPAAIPKHAPTPAPACMPFVCLPTPILKHPPIAHRNRPTKGLLSVFECAVATAVALSAIGALNAEKHKFSFGQGGKAIVTERRRPGKKGDALFIGGKNYFFKLAGQSGYFDAQQEFDRRPRPTITFEVSRRALLRAANASVGGKNVVRLTRALRRLLDPVRIDKGQFPPLLAAVEHLPNVVDSAHPVKKEIVETARRSDFVLQPV